MCSVAFVRAHVQPRAHRLVVTEDTVPIGPRGGHHPRGSRPAAWWTSGSTPCGPVRSPSRGTTQRARPGQRPVRTVPDGPREAEIGRLAGTARARHAPVARVPSGQPRPPTDSAASPRCAPNHVRRTVQSCSQADSAGSIPSPAPPQGQSRSLHRVHDRGCPEFRRTSAAARCQAAVLV